MRVRERGREREKQDNTKFLLVKAALECSEKIQIMKNIRPFRALWYKKISVRILMLVIT